MLDDQVGRPFLMVCAVYVLITAPLWWIAVRDHAKAIEKRHKRGKHAGITDARLYALRIMGHGPEASGLRAGPL